MEKTTRIIFGAAVCVAVLIATTQPAIAGIVNGEFNDNVDPNDGVAWETSGGILYNFPSPQKYVVLVQGNGADPPDSILSQTVTLEAGENWLSFFLKMNTGPSYETDIFTAVFGAELTTEEEFINGTEICEWISSDVAVDIHGYGTREEIITFNVLDAGFTPGNSYFLVFRLNHKIEVPDSIITAVTIDDVMLTPNSPMVPVPGALLHGGLGSALVVLMKKTGRI